nr:lipoyl(octanoyl) transferase LipB [uncultured Nitratireductor sp.]
MDKKLDRRTYEKRLEAQQLLLRQIQQAYLASGERAVIVFEGWDAGGKGGTIRRMSAVMDPRGFKVWPIAAPRNFHKERHFLYRFWERVPPVGAISVFDRSWYGRVLVERVERLTPEEDWRRGYREINEFERMLHDDGARIVKIFLHITPEEQLRRFEQRLTDPMKRWKLTDEDFRNRDRRPDYETAVAFMEERAGLIREGKAAEMVWLVEHPPLYTAGTSANGADLLEAGRFPVYKTGRGGEYTYHGPGQRVAYVMLDLKTRREDVRAFIAALETWIITTLARFNVTGERREDRVGVWVARPEKAPLPGDLPAEDKIAAIGIRLRRWVSFHGISINVEPELAHFGGIVPCGISGYGVTSLVDLGLPVTMEDVDLALKAAFTEVFGPAERR